MVALRILATIFRRCATRGGFLASGGLLGCFDGHDVYPAPKWCGDSQLPNRDKVKDLASVAFHGHALVLPIDGLSCGSDTRNDVPHSLNAAIFFRLESVDHVGNLASAVATLSSGSHSSFRQA